MSIHTRAIGISQNAKLLRTTVSKHAVIGAAIAIAATIIATILSSYFNEGGISLERIMATQKNNMILWVMDGMAFIFPLWGQYVSSILSYEASAMVQDQTHELRTYTLALEKKATHDATHDSLTNLPNRMLFLDRLQQAIHLASRDNSNLAVCILDIDRFKEVNDTLGHYNGDRLIKQLALRLTGIIRESDTLARIGGDEFGFVLPKMGKADDLKKLGKKLQKALEPPFVLENLSLDVSASIGAALYPQHGNDVDTLIQRADVAMYVAKQDNSGIVLYSKELDGHSPHRLTLGGELRDAIKNDALALCYQPKIFCKSNELHAVEVLVRWQHPNHGFMLPDLFIPMAERTGLIYDLTLWVLKHSLRQCRDWYEAGINLEISVNVSSLCLLDPEFPDLLAGMLASYELPAKSLMIEITETSIMVNPERSFQIVNRIADMGVGVSIDDFGTGYSSLAYLKKLPATELKVDKSFVKDMLENDSDMTIVNATIQLAHNLGLTVAAEGVENSATFNRLKAMGCDSLQGYFISQPLAADEFLTWLQTKGTSFLPPEKKAEQVTLNGRTISSL
jgi:diguanylate cyclase (GGDEF)-like protein